MLYAGVDAHKKYCKVVLTDDRGRRLAHASLSNDLGCFSCLKHVFNYFIKTPFIQVSPITQNQRLVLKRLGIMLLVAFFKVERVNQTQLTAQGSFSLVIITGLTPRLSLKQPF